MARNKVQFQKGLSEAGFEALYGSEEKCRAVVIASRWPDGFECPGCGGRAHCIVKSRGLFQCNACRRQTSPIAGTIFASTHLPLCLWFRAMYHLTQSKQGISSIELGRRLGVTQTTAWKIKHKLAQVMLERDAGKRLSGRVAIDDAYLGGERTAAIYTIVQTALCRTRHSSVGGINGEAERRQPGTLPQGHPDDK